MLDRVVNWLIRLFRLDITALDEAKLDPAATVTSLLVVVAASFVAGLGTWIWAAVEDVPDKGEVAVRSFILGGLLMAAMWLVWVGVVYVVLTQLYRSVADIQQLIRTMGLAFVPMALGVLIFISFLAIPLGVFALVATFVFTQYAIATATTASSGQITYANLAGFLVFAIVMGILGTAPETGAGFAPGVFFFSQFTSF